MSDFPIPVGIEDFGGSMTLRLLLALSLLFPAPAFAGGGPPEPRDVPEAAEPRGRLPAGADADAAMPDETDLEDGIPYYGFLRKCTEGRPPVLTIDLVQYYEGPDAVRPTGT